MKRTIQILILGFIFINGYGQKNKIQTETLYYDSKKTVIFSEKSFYKSGRKQILHGDFKEYYRNGQLMAIRTYDNGLLTGKWIKYYESGQVLFESNYKNGLCYRDYKKYYENGALMIEATCQSDKLDILKYGFPDGKYVISKQRLDSTTYYELYSNNRELINSAENDWEIFEDSSNFNCEFKTIQLNYPLILIDQQLEGLVIVKLFINKSGELINIEPIAGFHEEAIKETIREFKKNKCYMIRCKNGEPSDYELIFAVNFKII
jgi:hypothetical protein